MKAKILVIQQTVPPTWHRNLEKVCQNAFPDKIDLLSINASAIMQVKDFEPDLILIDSTTLTHMEDDWLKNYYHLFSTKNAVVVFEDYEQKNNLFPKIIDRLKSFDIHPWNIFKGISLGGYDPLKMCVAFFLCLKINSKPINYISSSFVPGGSIGILEGFEPNQTSDPSRIVSELDRNFSTPISLNIT